MILQKYQNHKKSPPQVFLSHISILESCTEVSQFERMDHILRWWINDQNHTHYQNTQHTEMLSFILLSGMFINVNILLKTKSNFFTRCKIKVFYSWQIVFVTKVIWYFKFIQRKTIIRSKWWYFSFFSFKF